MQEYIYYMDSDDYAVLVRDGNGGIEQLCRKNPVWRHACEAYWRELCLGQGFGCLQEISLEVAREYLTDWGVDPELAQLFPDSRV